MTSSSYTNSYLSPQQMNTIRPGDHLSVCQSLCYTANALSREGTTFPTALSQQATQTSTLCHRHEASCWNSVALRATCPTDGLQPLKACHNLCDTAPRTSRSRAPRSLHRRERAGLRDSPGRCLSGFLCP